MCHLETEICISDTLSSIETNTHIDYAINEMVSYAGSEIIFNILLII